MPMTCRTPTARENARNLLTPLIITYLKMHKQCAAHNNNIGDTKKKF